MVLHVQNWATRITMRYNGSRPTKIVDSLLFLRCFVHHKPDTRKLGRHSLLATFAA